MKRFISVFYLVTFLLAIFASCTSKTPDVVASEEAEVTLDDVNWSIPITIEATGETVTYTMEQAKAHELAKSYITCYQFDNGGVKQAAQVSTFILEGVKFSDVLEDIGVSDFSSITVEQNNRDETLEYEHDIAIHEGTLLGWIQNKKEVITSSAPSYCGFGSSEAGVNDFCHSLKSITIHP